MRAGLPQPLESRLLDGLEAERVPRGDGVRMHGGVVQSQLHQPAIARPAFDLVQQGMENAGLAMRRHDVDGRDVAVARWREERRSRGLDAANDADRLRSEE